jgi:Fur family iron response transcriptional regulator
VLGSTVWYDTNTGSHCHYFDERRQRLTDIPEVLTRDLKIAAPPGYRIGGIDLIVRLCDDETLN